MPRRRSPISMKKIFSVVDSSLAEPKVAVLAPVMMIAVSVVKDASAHLVKVVATVAGNAVVVVMIAEAAMNEVVVGKSQNHSMLIRVIRQ